MEVFEKEGQATYRKAKQNDIRIGVRKRTELGKVLLTGRVPQRELDSRVVDGCEAQEGEFVYNVGERGREEEGSRRNALMSTQWFSKTVGSYSYGR